MFSKLVKATRYLDRAIVWFTSFGLVWAAMTWLGKQLVVFGQLGWPELIFLGLGAACLLSLTLSVALIGWRLFRPLQPSPQVTEDGIEAGPEMLTKDTFAIEMERSDGRMATIAERLAERMDKADKAAKLIERRLEIMDALAGKSMENSTKLLDLVTTHIEEAKNDIESVNRRVTRLADQHDDIRVSLIAIYERERMTAFAQDIEESANCLTAALADGKVLDDESWQQWLSDERKFRSFIGKWCDFAQHYVRQPDQTIWQPDEEAYESNWSVSHTQFVTPTDIHKFKLFRIGYRNWQNMRHTAEGNARRVAFEGASMPVVEIEGD